MASCSQVGVNPSSRSLVVSGDFRHVSPHFTAGALNQSQTQNAHHQQNYPPLAAVPYLGVLKDPALAHVMGQSNLAHHLSSGGPVFHHPIQHHTLNPYARPSGLENRAEFSVSRQTLPAYPQRVISEVSVSACSSQSVISPSDTSTAQAAISNYQTVSAVGGGTSFQVAAIVGAIGNDRFINEHLGTLGFKRFRQQFQSLMGLYFQSLAYLKCEQVFWISKEPKTVGVYPEAFVAACFPDPGPQMIGFLHRMSEIRLINMLAGVVI